MDTKRLESIGETSVVGVLLESGILVAKPFFDRSGADLIGFTSVDDTGRFFRIQCKYRELKNRTSVVVPSEYVTGAFVLFLKLKTPDGAHLLCFLPDDMKRHFREGQQRSSPVLRLTITARNVLPFVNDTSLHVTPDKVSEILALVRSSSPDAEMRRALTDVIKAARNVNQVRAKRDRLQQLVYDVKMARLEKESAEQSLETLEDYLAYIESHEKELKQQLAAGKLV